MSLYEVECVRGCVKPVTIYRNGNTNPTKHGGCAFNYVLDNEVCHSVKLPFDNDQYCF